MGGGGIAVYKGAGVSYLYGDGMASPQRQRLRRAVRQAAHQLKTFAEQVEPVVKVITFLGLLIGIFTYVTGVGGRDQTFHNSAWQVINGALGQPYGGGTRAGITRPQQTAVLRIWSLLPSSS
jgi:hypothetical protein